MNEYGNFVAVDDVKVNGKLTLGENTADNGGLLLAYMAYLDRAKKNGVDVNAKKDGYTGPQRFYIGYAQNYCENSRPELIRNQVLTRSALAGPLPGEWGDCESAGICGGVWMQEGMRRWFRWIAAGSGDAVTRD